MPDNIKHLKKTVLLAAASPRSKAYIQALVAHRLYPEKVILLAEDQSQKTMPRSIEKWQGVHLPDLNETIVETCQKAGISYEIAPVDNINAPETVALIQAHNAETVIYSGKGGQIVKDSALNAAGRFLHMHSGWLPEYRGSTTVYYALLNGDLPAVTAIFLNRGIDTGPIIAKKKYPRPSTDLNIDLEYDCAIRADLMVEVMRGFVETADILVQEMQTPDKGEVYYVIHPVLKHIAILSLQKGLKEC